MNIFRAISILILALVLASCLPAGSANQPTPTLFPPTPLPTELATAVPLPTFTPTESLPTPTSVPPTLTPPPPTPTIETTSSPGIILFIGDGMGAVHRQAATWLVSGQGGLLVMDNMPVHGLAQTTSADSAITDSAASATAMATGTLTRNGYLGVDPSQNTLTTILELAQVSGWSVGLVSTVQLAHATPGAFASHWPDRDNLPEVARQIMSHQVDVLLGGGEDNFYSRNESGCYEGKGQQRSGSDLVAMARDSGYTYICTADALQTLDLAEVDRLLGLFGGNEIYPAFGPTLAEMTQAAISILSRDPDGFFLMVEAGQIDWEAHVNAAEQTIRNTVELDTAVAMAKVFALGSPNTLIIVAADHETGGMRLNLDGKGSFRQDGPFSMPDGTSFWVDWTTGSHTADPIPVTAQGPYSDMLAGEYPITRIFETMAAMLFESQ